MDLNDTQNSIAGDCSMNDIKPDGPSLKKRARRGEKKYCPTGFGTLSHLVSQETLKRIKFDFLKPFQAHILPSLVEGHDLIGLAGKTSGKRLAYCIQLVELLRKTKSAKEPGTKALILIKDRDSAMRSFNELRPLADEDSTIGLLVGGVDKDEEAKMLHGGVTILIAMPGYFLGHIKNTKKFVYKHLKYLVVDNADDLLRMGFEEVLLQILAKLPKRQTALFCSSTDGDPEVEQLARKAIGEIRRVGLEPLAEPAPQLPVLELNYIVAKSELRCKMLHTFLHNTKDTKMVVLFASDEQVEFYNRVFQMRDQLILALQEDTGNVARADIIETFRNEAHVKLFATLEQVEELAMTKVDWFVQFDPPYDLKDYIKRGGRPASDLRDQGKALLFVRPEEINVLIHLEEARFRPVKYYLKDAGDPEFQSTLNGLVEEEPMLCESAREAYKAYFIHYNSLSLKQIFDSGSLNLTLVAKSYGFQNPAGQIFV